MTDTNSFISTKNNLSIKKQVTKTGWKKYDVGSTSNIDYNYRFDLYIRARRLAAIKQSNGDIQEKSPTQASLKLDNSNTSNMVSNASMGFPKQYLTPSENLPVLSDFSKYASLLAARPTTSALVIGFDSEWYYPNNSVERIVITWQFSLIWGENLVEFLFIRKTLKYALHIELAIGRILDFLQLPKTDIRKVHKYCSLGELDSITGLRSENSYALYSEAAAASKLRYTDGKLVHNKQDWNSVTHIPVILLCHAGKADITTLDQHSVYRKEILKFCSEVQGGLISLQPTYIYPSSVDPQYATNRHTYKYAISLSIADTMCHAPAQCKTLKSLGHTIGWEKVELAQNDISEMNVLLKKDPCKYFEYAATDSTVALLYAAALYGYNKKIPVTVTSATAKVMKEIMMKYLKCNNNKEFDLKFRGLTTESHGLVPRSDNKPGYIESQSKEPISREVEIIQTDASHAFHGGYNSCSDIGYFPYETTDYDLQNAYPTAMCLVADVDWDNPIKYKLHHETLTLQSFAVGMGGINPLPLMFAYVTFEFPEDVKYPCIPVNVDGIPIYPRTSSGLNGVFACGPELYLAVRLGAKVYIQDGYVLNTLLHGIEESFSLRQAVYQLVRDRKQAKKDHGKGSLEELILKTMVNSGYGKTAQNVIQKNTWTAFKDEMEDIGCSSITNPVSAAMITSIVRAELLAAQNQCNELGYMTCSVTTDGFISDVPEKTLKTLDLYGIRKFMEKARLYLTDGTDSEIWEAKHKQNDLVNFTTRGNVSLYCSKNPYISGKQKYQGVCAHNSTKSGYPSDTYEDRLWLIQQVLGRTGTVNYTTKEWPSFKELVQGKVFSVREITRHIRMDFDMIRKPVRDSFCTKLVTVNNTVYAIANFTTIPFDDVSEFRLYRRKKELTSVLRTESDWDLFWRKIDLKATGCKVRDMDWAILNSCIMGHRCNRWIIPKLNELSGQERCDWINAHNTSSKIFKENDWKNAGRPKRQVNMLPDDFLKEKLSELINDIKK